MPPDMPKYLANRRQFLANRAKAPAEVLAKYAGQWVAWSPDGSRVAASSADPGELDALLRAAREDPAMCVVEGIPGEEAMVIQDVTTSDVWTEDKNRRRENLLNQKYDRGLSAAEEVELTELRRGWFAYVDRVAALPIEAARRMYEELLQKASNPQQQ